MEMNTLARARLEKGLARSVGRGAWRGAKWAARNPIPARVGIAAAAVVGRKIRDAYRARKLRRMAMVQQRPDFHLNLEMNNLRGLDNVKDY